MVGPFLELLGQCCQKFMAATGRNEVQPIVGEPPYMLCNLVSAEKLQLHAYASCRPNHNQRLWNEPL